jgi:NADPH:quinone reductase-like Zn-dependent oxidoreductase
MHQARLCDQLGGQDAIVPVLTGSCSFNLSHAVVHPQAPGFPRGTVIKTKPRVERNRVLVTGGAGFVGSHLCEFLVNRGDHVSCPHP